MSFDIRYFAAVREALGRDEERIPVDALPDSPTIADLWAVLVERHPELESMADYLRVARNHDFVGEDAPIEDGDEIALIPPVSGGSGEPPREDDSEPQEATTDDGRFRVTTDPLRAESVVDRVRRPEAGGLVTFEGVVRDHTDDHSVETLVYECYVEMALQKLVETGREAADQWPRVEVAIHHRHGRLEVGEAAVVIAVSSPHRGPAFEACRWVIDRLKEVVPIWKKETGPDGESWVGMGP